MSDEQLELLDARSRRGRQSRRRGHDRERAYIKRQTEDGWFSMRAPASLGAVDVVSIKPGSVEFAEVKSTAAGPFADFGPKDRERLLTTADFAGATAVLVWWPKHKQPVKFYAHSWPSAR